MFPLNFIFHKLIHTWRISTIKYHSFIWNKIRKNIRCFIKYIDLFMDTFVGKHCFPYSHINRFPYNLIICFSVPLILWEIFNIEAKLTVKNLMVAIRVKCSVNSTISYQVGLVIEDEINLRD